MRVTMKRILLLLCIGPAVVAFEANAATSPRNLIIQVRIDADNSQSRQGADVSGSVARGRHARIALPGGDARLGDTTLHGHIYESQRSSRNSSIQQVTVIEGGQAFVNVGESVVVPMHQILLSPVGVVISDSVLIYDLGIGFYARPNISGNRVILDITAYQDTPNSSPFDVNTTRISTTVAGKLGEWIRLGGSRQQEGVNRGGIGNYTTQSGTSDRQVWLKVDAGP